MTQNDKAYMSGDRETMRQQILRHTPPLSNNPKISFPEHYAKGRIVIRPGERMLDWDGEQWIVYVKDGVRWFSEVLSDEDYDILYDALSIQLKEF